MLKTPELMPLLFGMNAGVAVEFLGDIQLVKGTMLAGPSQTVWLE
jgi:hypothetical protein